MVCTLHPNRQAGSVCEICGQPFCEECLVEVSGKYYCKEHVAQLINERREERGPHNHEHYGHHRPYERDEHFHRAPDINIYNAPHGSGYSGPGYGYGYYPYKNRVIALLLCIFLGVGGFHRFYVGKIGTGVLYLFTGGLFGIGWIVDIVCIALGSFRDGYGYPLT